MTNRMDMAALEDEDLSALADGELGAGAAERLCGQWRGDAALRERWHAYHLIGDVLRSEELAATPARDEAFLLALRARMASEPVLVAPVVPAAVVAAPAGRHRAVSFGAIAAGFVVVAAGALTLLGQPTGGGSPAGAPTEQIAKADPGQLLPVNVGVRADPAGDLQPTAMTGQLIRDAKLDSYLSAHRQWSDGAMLGGHAAYLRFNPGDGPAR